MASTFSVCRSQASRLPLCTAVPDGDTDPGAPVVVIFSGKRKSGKDHAASLLVPRLSAVGLSVWVGQLSVPIKLGYAKEHGLDFERLQDSSSYKETCRAEMIAWGIERRDKDAHVFCREVVKSEDARSAHLWLITDARRPSDLQYYIRRCSRPQTILVRIVASEDSRKNRGWIFKDGVDNADSECALDAWTDWDIIVQSGQDQEVEHVAGMDAIFAAIVERLGRRGIHIHS